MADVATLAVEAPAPGTPTSPGTPPSPSPAAPPSPPNLTSPDTPALPDTPDTPTTPIPPNKDRLFDPSVDMLVNDFDDERTLDEEEAMAAGESEDANAELTSLQKESDMPLDQLLAMYGYRDMQDNDSPMDDDEDDDGDDEGEDDDEDDEADMSPAETMDDQESETNDIPDEASKLNVLYDSTLDNDPTRLLRSFLAVSRVSEEEDEDYDYSPDEDEWRKVNKTIMVGTDYQAVIPEGLQHYDDALPYENEDKLLFDPSQLGADVIDDFLIKASVITKPPIPVGSQIRDDEQALYLLQQCGHNVEEALRRIRINVMPTADSMSLWSEEECRNFESGVRSFGKNFHLIQQHKVRTRSVGELVQFYYLWKKSERHDIFANKSRLEKKKYTLHPGLTDFMDRFLEDQDGSRDRSSSPSVPTAGTPERRTPTEGLPLHKPPLDT